MIPTVRVHRSLPRRLVREVAGLASALAISLMIGLVGMTTVSACGWLKSEAKTTEIALIDCAKQDVTAGSLLQDVSTALANGANWRADLAALETKYGAEALACAVKVVDEVFSPALKGGERLPPAQRAEQVIAQHGWQYR